MVWGRVVLAVLAVIACSGETVDTGAVAGGTAADPSPGVGAGEAHEVRMLLTGDGRYVYQPAELTIAQGDRVRWINVSGSPHNVAFYAESIPAGAKDVLNAAMVDKIGDLAGKLMLHPNQVYEVSFTGAPAGRYEYFCTPHEMLGMKATLTIQ